MKQNQYLYDCINRSILILCYIDSGQYLHYCMQYNQYLYDSIKHESIFSMKQQSIFILLHETLLNTFFIASSTISNYIIT